jgi:4-hydroxy-4-methyl-2-oxoglutarate aldolase
MAHFFVITGITKIAKSRSAQVSAYDDVSSYPPPDRSRRSEKGAARMYDIVKDFPRPSREVIRKLGEMQSATLHEAMGKRGALPGRIKPIWPESVLVGVALTVKSRPGDNIMLHKAVSLAQPGDILVVDCDGFLEAGLWGEIISVAAMQRGVAGIVTNGAVRDTMPIRALVFPVFCAGISIKGTTKAVGGTINLPVSFEGVVVHPGDVVVGDNDGVVVVPRDEADRVLEAATAKEKAEADIIRRIRNGESTMDLLNLTEAYARLGLREES